MWRDEMTLALNAPCHDLPALDSELLVHTGTGPTNHAVPICDLLEFLVCHGLSGAVRPACPDFVSPTQAEARSRHHDMIHCNGFPILSSKTNRVRHLRGMHFDDEM